MCLGDCPTCCLAYGVHAQTWFEAETITALPQQQQRQQHAQSREERRETSHLPPHH